MIIYKEYKVEAWESKILNCNCHTNFKLFPIIRKQQLHDYLNITFYSFVSIRYEVTNRVNLRNSILMSKRTSVCPI